MEPIYPSYYQKYPMFNFSESYRELEYLNQLYPKEIRELREVVKETCDKMDYEGSMMYDEYPDKVMFMKVCNDVCAIANCSCAYAKKCTDKAWLKDMVSVLMSDEMYKRRSKRNQCCNKYAYPNDFYHYR